MKPEQKHTGSLLDDTYLIYEDAEAFRAYEASIQAAKASSILVQDQERSLRIIYPGNKHKINASFGEFVSEGLKPDTIYGPFSIEYRIEDACAHDSCPMDAGCEHCKEPVKVAILLPDNEPQEDQPKVSNLKQVLQDKIMEFEAHKTDPRYQTEMEQNAVAVTLRELKYLDSIAEYE